METGERERWNERHRAGSVRPPSDFLLEVASRLPRGRCIDLAAGRGAEALFMAELGYRVDAIDLSIEGLERTRAEACRRRLSLNLLVADLTAYPLPVARYDVVLCFHYLDRDLWPAMARAMRPSGALVLQNFTLERKRLRPDFPEAYCLSRGELLRAFPGLRIALYREMPGEETASLLAFRPPDSGGPRAAGFREA